MTIVYRIGNSLYLNITNKCSCACTFCIRIQHDGVKENESLWLEKEPSFDEIIEQLEMEDLSNYEEIVFCGYGEPTESLELLLELCRYLKHRCKDIPVRLNTNGLGNLINQENIVLKLNGFVDSVSISLNASNAESYHKMVDSKFGEMAFSNLLIFADQCKELIKTVQFTVVDVISEEEIMKCQKLADKKNIPLRVRRHL